MSAAPATAGLQTKAGPRSQFLNYHLWIPLASTLALSWLLMTAGGDRWLASLLYQAQGGQWALKGYWITATLVHQGGKFTSIAAALGLLLYGVLAWRRPDRRPQARAALYVTTAVAASTAAVSLFKSLTRMDCPWDLVSYGGNHPFIGLFESRHGLPAANCFPAGHASAGYAWVALYFAALAVRPRWRKAGLAIGLGSGLLFGICQQLRGAHFASHDLWTLAVCWSVSLALYLTWLRPAALSNGDVA